MQNRKGFTLIELLIVVVIIGILAAIAIPKFANTKEKAVLASMKSDLRNLVTAQEGYFSDNQSYAAAIGAAQGAGVAAFVPSQNNTITLSTVTAGGWAAQATGREAEPRLPVSGVSLHTCAAGNPSRRASRAGRRPLPPWATTARSCANGTCCRSST